MDPITLALIGAGANLGGTLISSWLSSDAAEEEKKAKQEAADMMRKQGQITDQQYARIAQEISDYYDSRVNLGKESDVNQYRNAIESYNPEDYAADISEFQYDKTKEDFLNPYYNQIIGDTAAQIQHSAAGAGLGRGTGAALGIAQGVADKSNELYKTALGEYQQDRDFAYKSYADAIANNQKRLDSIRSGTEYKMALQGNLAQDYVGTQDQAMADRIKAEQDRLAAKQGYDTAVLGLY